MAHESIEYGMNDVKELFDSSVMTGTIVEVNYDSDTAKVAIDGVGQKSGIPIFYHCADADTVAGGSTAFIEGDSVYILNKAGSMKIMGFTDGLKQCAFQFKITRDDEEIIDESYNPTFQILNSNKDEVTGDATYNSETEYWMITLDQSYEIDPEGYWVSFIDIEDSIDLQYPFKYKYDDQEKTEDLIRIGKYDAAVPYWKIEDYEDAPDYTGQCSGSLGDIYLKFVTSWQRKRTIKTSVSYRVTYNVNSNSNTRLADQHERTWCNYGAGNKWLFDCAKPLTLCASCFSDGTVRAMAGDINEVNPYNGSSSNDITVTEYTEAENSITLTYIGPGSFELECYNCCTDPLGYCTATLSSFTTTYRLSGQHKSGLSIGYEYDY